MLSFPPIDPVAVHLGPLPIRWYSLAYLGGILLGWWFLKKEHARKPVAGLTQKAIDDLIVWAVIGIILGGRFGYALFYKPELYLAHPALILKLWEGGMSFHGGMIGLALAFFLFCRKHNIRFLELMDVVACAVPIGLFFGRIANFINGELYGRPTDASWGMIFPHGGDVPRHPSQLYEAGLEGLFLFGTLFFLLKHTSARERPGFLTGAFLVGYALARIAAEVFREPDPQLGFLLVGATMGQLLSLPMLALGGVLLCRTPNPRPKTQS